MLKPSSKRTPKGIAARSIAAQPSHPTVTTSSNDRKEKSGQNSKQARAVEMLRSPTGTTIAAVMKATGWQLRSELGDSHQAVKKVMRWTRASERTVKNWLAGRRGPRGEHLLALIRHSNVVLEIVLELAGREQIIAGKGLFDARNALADMLAQIDSLMNDAGRPR